MNGYETKQEEGSKHVYIYLFEYAYVHPSYFPFLRDDRREKMYHPWEINKGKLLLPKTIERI